MTVNLDRAAGCNRCNGTGEYHGTRRDGSSYIGSCFACQGGGYSFRRPAFRATNLVNPISPAMNGANGQPAVLAAPVSPARTRAASRAVANWQAFQAAFPAEAGWLESNSTSSPFAVSLQSGVCRYGNLTPRQLAAVQRNLPAPAAPTPFERLVAAHSEPAIGTTPDGQPVTEAEIRAGEPVLISSLIARPVPTAPAILIDVTRLNTAMQAAAASGLRKVRLTMGHVEFKLGRNGRYSRQNFEGYLLAYYQGVYVGKVFAATGAFTWSARGEVTGAIDALRLAAADPQAAARTHGLDTGICGCCRRTLTDPPSVMAGIGPVCIRRFGWSF